MNTSNNVNMTQKFEPKIGKTFRGGGSSKYGATSFLVTIPHEYISKYGLQDPTNVIFIPTDKGILIRRFEVPKDV